MWRFDFRELAADSVLGCMSGCKMEALCGSMLDSLPEPPETSFLRTYTRKFIIRSPRKRSCLGPRSGIWGLGFGNAFHEGRVLRGEGAMNPKTRGLGPRLGGSGSGPPSVLRFSEIQRRNDGETLWLGRALLQSSSCS